MYTHYYGFREKPFALSPDPRFLFLSASHREVLGHLVYGIEQGEGFMAITGEVGTGKTTLCRTLLRRLGSESEVAFIFNPALTPLELLKAINAEFDLSVFGDSRPELTDVLNTFLLEKSAEGRRVLLIVDEAQNLSEETLEQLRLLSNLETETSKLLQIVLLGQPELDQKLSQPELRQLRQRIGVWWRLGPLAAAETREYVRHRLRVAGALERPIFTETALRVVHRISGGIPRLVNLLCDRALLAGYADSCAQIGPQLVWRAAAELRPVSHTAARRRRAWAAAAAAALLAVGAGALLGRGLSRDSDVAAAPPLPPQRAEVAPAASPPFRLTVPEAGGARALAALAGPELAARPPVPAEDVLDALLSLKNPEQHRAAALDAAFAAWRLPPSGAVALGEAELRERLRGRKFQLLPVPAEISSLAEAAAPALVALRDSRGEAHPALLRHLGGGVAELEGIGPTGGGVRIDLAEFEQHLFGEAFALWRNFAELPDVLEPGDQGFAVVWLQQALSELDYYRQEVHGHFDVATRDAVARFQRDRGLRADGGVGPRTQMRLYEALPRYATPSLASNPLPSPERRSSAQPASDAIGLARSR